jgi:hypothetical protein
MLTSFPGWESITPAAVDAIFANLPDGYQHRAYINFAAIGEATSQLIQCVDRSDAHSDADIDAYLNTHFCGNGERVILKLNETITKAGFTTNSTHFILVTGKAGNDWTVFDPGWTNAVPLGNLTSLLAHEHGNGFTTSSGTVTHQFTVAGVRSFNMGSPLALALDGSALSPVELLVTDPIGRRVGYNPSAGQDVSEIPNGVYYRDLPILADDDTAPEITDGDASGIKTFHIPTPIAGTYHITGIGTGSGAYTLNVKTIVAGNLAQTATYQGNASAGVTFSNDFVVIAPPQITIQPTNQAALPGGQKLFTVAASGSGPLYYQWRFNGTNLAGATAATISLTNIQPWNAGNYQVVVTNAGGAATSVSASLSVLGVPVTFVTGNGGIHYTNGQLHLRLGNLTGQGAVVLMGSTNLINWNPILTNASGFGEVEVIDPVANNYRQRFYRAITPAAP